MRRARVDLRVRADEKAAWATEAKRRGLDLSELIRRRMNAITKKAA